MNLDTFFKGSVDDLLNNLGTAPISEIDKAVDENRMLSPQEMTECIMDDLKISKEEAQKVVKEIQLSEMDRICNKMVEKGLLEVFDYDEDGNPKYRPTNLGKEVVSEIKRQENEKNSSSI